MMKTIYFRYKPFLFLLGISICIVLWMMIGRYRPLPMEKRVLRTEGPQFYLEGKPFRILSGSIHYFRVVPEYWKDRLQKLKYMGLNTVETYVPWNLHEEIKGKLNFKGILDIEQFIREAHSLGLYVIIRPGPYICAEWDLGGLPSWLLRDPKMSLRSMYSPFINAVDRFFNKLIPILAPYQFSHGGPIIAFQVENEYGSFGREDLSSEYMAHLKDLMISAGLSEFLFTSDGIKQIQHNDYQLPGVLKTVNFQNNETTYLAQLKELQPNKPLMVAEFWPGWFDHWGENHHKMEVEKVVSRVSNILKTGASINFYMFHGGTNFGFMNGGNYAKLSEYKYQPTVTSYDYDAPLSEAGDITEKFKALKKVIKEHNPYAEEKIPSKLSNHHRMAYEVVEIQHFVQLRDILPFCTSVESDVVMPMEMLPINDDSGQGYGFTLYQAQLEKAADEITIHKVSDRAQVLLDSQVIHTIDAMKHDEETHYIDERDLSTVKIKLKEPKMGLLGILVENLGRVNFLKPIDRQRKGILGDVEVDGNKPTKWKIFALEFKEHFLDKLSESKSDVWKKLKNGNIPAGPTLYRGVFAVSDAPSDTFLHMKGWIKGVCFVNGHNLGRYWNVGPQETLYVPAPWLRKGENELLVFELESCEAPEVSFSTEPVVKGNPVYSW